MYNDADNMPQSFIIYDTEYTSWRGSQERGWSGQREYQELVQIGAIHVIKRDSKYYVARSLNIIMRPEQNSILSQYFVDLTGIEQIDVDQGVSIIDGIREFKDFADCDDCFSYGNDYDIIEKNLDLLGIGGSDSLREWKEKHYDIRIVLDKFIDTSKYTSGEIYKGLTSEDVNLRNHNALQDCYSILYALNHIISSSC